MAIDRVARKKNKEQDARLDKILNEEDKTGRIPDLEAVVKSLVATGTLTTDTLGELADAVGLLDARLTALEAATQPPPEPEPEPTPKGVSVGGQFVYDFTQAAQQREIDLMVAAGVTWLRIDFAYGNTGKPRDLARRAHDQGLKILGTIIPRGTRTPVEGGAFARAEAPFMDAMEVGNEYNLLSQYSATPEEYAKLYNACKGNVALVSDIPVLTSGMSPGPNVTGDIDPRTFLDRALAAGMEPDAIAFHPYCQPAFPSADLDWSTWTKMKRWMAAHPEFSIWITEVGAFTGTHKNARRPPSPQLTEAQQKLFVIDVFSEAKKLGITTPIMWYQGRDGGTDPANDQHNYGLLRSDFSPKPAYEAFKEA